MKQVGCTIYIFSIQIQILEVLFIVFCLYEYIKYILVTRCVSEWTKEYTYLHYIWMLELCIIYVIVSIYLVCLYEYVDGGLQSVVISTVFSSILHMTPHYNITIYRVDWEFNICIDDIRVSVYHFTSIRIFYLYI